MYTPLLEYLPCVTNVSHAHGWHIFRHPRFVEVSYRIAGKEKFILHFWQALCTTKTVLLFLQADRQHGLFTDRKVFSESNNAIAAEESAENYIGNKAVCTIKWLYGKGMLPVAGYCFAEGIIKPVDITGYFFHGYVLEIFNGKKEVC
jgi:hypothetical protein